MLLTTSVKRVCNDHLKSGALRAGGNSNNRRHYPSDVIRFIMKNNAKKTKQIEKKLCAGVFPAFI